MPSFIVILWQQPKSITFSPFLKYNDGQLEELLISNYGLSKIEAADQIKKLSIEIIEEIKESGSYSIPGIGILINDSKGSINLTSEESSSQRKSTDHDDGKNIQTTNIDPPLEVDASTGDKNQTTNDLVRKRESSRREHYCKTFKEVSLGLSVVTPMPSTA